MDGDTRPHVSIYTLPGDAPAQGDTTRRSDSVLPLPGADQEPARIGGYRVLRELGRGGMGVVYLAEAVALRRQVALKVLFGTDAELVERFQLEARAAARVKHPNVVGVHEVGRDGARWFLAMDLVEGESLRARLQRDGPLDPREAARICEAIGRALHQAHTLGVLHRDVKPHNVLLSRDGTPQLADFGLAKDVGASAITATGDVLGTPAYMSPEQASGDHARVDRRTDVYSLGATLYEALTGRPPFEGGAAIHILRQVIEDPPSPPSRHRPGLDRDLQTIVLACLEKEPAARYDTAGELADDLGRWLRHEPIVARPQGALVRVAKWGRRRPLGAAAVGLALLTSTAAVTAALVVSAERAAERGRARAAARDALTAAAVTSQTDDQRERLASVALLAAQRWRELAPDDAAATDAVVEAALGAAAASRRIGDVRTTLEAYTLAADLRPTDSDLARAREAAAALVRWAQARHDADAPNTRAALQEALRLEPGWVEPWLWLARLHVDLEEHGLALTATDQALRLGGPSAEISRIRVKAALAMGDLAGGLAECDALVERWPTALAFAVRAEVKVRRGDVAGAVDDLTTALTREPQVAQRWRRRGELRGELGDPGHLDDLVESTRLAPADPFAWIQLGKAQARADRRDEALQALNQAVEVGPTLAEAWWVRANVHALRGDQAAALRDIDRALGLAPDDPRLLAERAGFTITDDPAASERTMDRALSTVGVVVPIALARRAEARRLRGKLEDAADDATAAIAIKPSMADAWLIRGKVRFQQDRRDEAIADFERLLHLAPDHVEAGTVRAAVDRLRRR